jgi:class 3 adenylate cyclase
MRPAISDVEARVCPNAKPGTPRQQEGAQQQAHTEAGVSYAPLQASPDLRGLVPALLSTTFRRRFDAALLFADLSGFTALTDRFAAQGPAGAEALARLLNLCFGRLADEILAAGGDVLHFAGDAPIALFPEHDEPGAASALARASACALRLQTAMPELSTAAGQALSLRIAVTRGEFTALSVGAHADRREFVVAGPAFAAIAPTLAVAQPGETWLATADGRELLTGAIGAPPPSRRA